MPSHGAYIYLIREGSRIKVGRTKSVISRLRLFQTGNAEECHVVAAVWLLNAGEVEKQLKDELAEYRHRGEWFTVSTRQALAKLCALRTMFLYDEPPQLDLPTPQNPLENECRSKFFDWIKHTYPDAKYASLFGARAVADAQKRVPEIARRMHRNRAKRKLVLRFVNDLTRRCNEPLAALRSSL